MAGSPRDSQVGRRSAGAMPESEIVVITLCTSRFQVADLP